MTKNELARKFDISLPTLSAWIAEGLPCIRKGKKYNFDIKKVEAWVTKYKLPKSATDMSYAESKRRHEAAKAGIKELELAVRKGELLHVDALMQIQGYTLKAIRTKILALPNKLAILSFGVKSIAENESILRKGIHEVLDEISVIDLRREARAQMKKGVKNETKITKT